MENQNNVKKIYKLNPGETAVVVSRTGRSMGQYGERVLNSIAIETDAGKFVRRGRLTYWIASTSTYYSHYKSGVSISDSKLWAEEIESLQRVVDLINQEGFVRDRYDR